MSLVSMRQFGQAGHAGDYAPVSACDAGAASVQNINVSLIENRDISMDVTAIEV